MKNFENLTINSLDSNEMRKLCGGWADSTNDGMFGEGEQYTGSGGSGSGLSDWQETVLDIIHLFQQ